MTVRALWLPYEVSDLDAAVSFYTDHLGLPTVDGWDRPGSRGVVLRVADAAFVELATPGSGAPARVAVELDSHDAVDRAWRRFALAGPPRRFDRGHYGFDAEAPGPGRLMVWSGS
jgi:catechol 2,3-dioxygenase-like lactoylglutathione lyase family enzyme